MSIFFDNTNKSDMGKLIHVGAGSGIDLNGYLDQRFTEIVLLEPIPKVFKQLTSKIEKLNKKKPACKLSALNLALSCTTNTDNTEQEKNFYITQPNRYSGFHKATKLKTLFQNFKTEQEINVNIINFIDLITKVALNKDKNNALVLQINGTEFDVLAQAKADELMLFSSIIIQQAKNNYFEEAKASSDLVKLMESKGFQLMLEVSNDAVFTNLTFRKDERALELKILNEKSEVQSKRIAELELKLQEDGRRFLAEKETLKSEHAESSCSTKLGQKMLAKAQLDLDNLRESYSEKVASETELVELIKELREKLTLASKYYVQLQQEHPELLLASNANESA